MVHFFCGASRNMSVVLSSALGLAPTAIKRIGASSSLSSIHRCGPASSPRPLPASGDDTSEVESQLHRVINFYHLVEVSDPSGEVEKHKQFLDDNGIDVRGRIYISTQGINAQFSGTVEHVLQYTDWVRARPGFADLSFSADPVDNHTFPRLRLKAKPHLVSLKGGHTHLPVTDPEQRATKLSPAEWRTMLGGHPSSDGGLSELSQAVVLDVRNDYEWDVGHFQGAKRPAEHEFRETPTDEDLPEHLKGVSKDTPIMMYCTGGIRCDIYSPALRRHGFTNLYTLEGGIANYLRTEGGDLWDGSLFVFDNRMVLPGDMTGQQPNKALSAAVPCELCGSREPVVPHLNCANIDCNKLFLACEPCRTRMKGCCCDECTNPPRMLRPLKADGYYGSWKEYSQGKESELAIASGRGEGRRRRRAAKLAAKATAKANSSVPADGGPGGQKIEEMTV